MLPLLMAVFNITLQIVHCDWMLCWMVHGASALLSMILFHWFSVAAIMFSSDYPAIYILILCSFSSLLVGSIMSAHCVALTKQLIPQANLNVLCLGLDAVSLVNALATVAFISISNGAQGLVAAFVISPLVCCPFLRCILHLQQLFSFAIILLSFPAVLCCRIVSASIVSFFCGFSRLRIFLLCSRFCWRPIHFWCPYVCIRSHLLPLACPIFNIFFLLASFCTTGRHQSSIIVIDLW